MYLSCAYQPYSTTDLFPLPLPLRVQGGGVHGRDQFGVLWCRRSGKDSGRASETDTAAPLKFTDAEVMVLFRCACHVGLYLDVVVGDDGLDLSDRHLMHV